MDPQGCSIWQYIYIVYIYHNYSQLITMDWFMGKCTGKPHIWWEKPWFPVDFPLNQSIDITMETHVGGTIFCCADFADPNLNGCFTKVSPAAAPRCAFLRSVGDPCRRCQQRKTNGLFLGNMMTKIDSPMGLDFILFVVGGLEHLDIFGWFFPMSWGISSSQLTNSYSSEGCLNHQPVSFLEKLGLNAYSW